MSVSTSLNVSAARSQLAELIDRAHHSHEPVFLSRRGRRVAAIIDADDLDRLISLAEDMEDIRAAQAARDEMQATGQAAIPWEEVKAELGMA